MDVAKSSDGRLEGDSRMAENKTRPTDETATDFLNSVDHRTRREDGFTLLKIMEEITGEDAVMWGSSIVGFGSYHYKYKSGHEGDAPLIGFSPRKPQFSLYVYSKTDKSDELLKSLGKFKI